jgi:hypothetical protein
MVMKSLIIPKRYHWVFVKNTLTYVKLRPNIEEWLNENCLYVWKFRNELFITINNEYEPKYYIDFFNDSDYVTFTLRWL